MIVFLGFFNHATPPDKIGIEGFNTHDHWCYRCSHFHIHPPCPWCHPEQRAKAASSKGVREGAGSPLALEEAPRRRRGSD